MGISPHIGMAITQLPGGATISNTDSNRPANGNDSCTDNSHELTGRPILVHCATVNPDIVLSIKEESLHRILGWTRAADYEISGIGEVYKTEKGYHIEDVYLLATGTAAATTITAKQMGAFLGGYLKVKATHPY